MLHDVEKLVVTVSVDGELVTQEVYVDTSTGLDIDPHTGIFRTREQTEALVKEVYRIGRDALPRELDRYNKWMQGDSCTHNLQLISHCLPSMATRAGSSTAVSNKLEEAEEWKARGNDAMRLCDARRAACCYSEALRHKPSSSTLWANRAAAMIHLGRGDDALSDAERAISLDPANVKAYYRKTFALCLLGARAAANHCLKDSVKRFGANTAWDSLGRRIGAMPRAVLVDHRWICSEDVAEGEELCALEGLKLPSTDAYEVLRLWAKNGVPPEVLAKEAAYYALRGCEPVFEVYNGVMAVRKVYDMWLDVDPAAAAGAQSVDVLRWCCLLLDPADAGIAANTGPWSEKIFEDGYVILGASLFWCSPVCEANVTLCFDPASHFLRVIAQRHIKQYETLSSSSRFCK